MYKRQLFDSWRDFNDGRVTERDRAPSSAARASAPSLSERVLAAAGYNFGRLLAWFAILWRVLNATMLADASDAAVGEA